MRSWTHQDVTKVFAALAVPAAVLLLSGCGSQGGPPPDPAVESTYAEAPPDASECSKYDDSKYGQINSANCYKRIDAERKAYWDRRRSANAQLGQQSAAWQQKTNFEKFFIKNGDRIVQGLVLCIFAVVIAGSASLAVRHSDSKALKRLPRHRDPNGPAGAAMTARASQIRMAGWAGVAVSIVPIAMIFGEGPAVVAILAAVCVAGFVATQWHRLGVARAGYRIADSRWQEAALESERLGQPVQPEPRASVSDAVLLGRTEGFEPPPGSAQEVMLDLAGRTGKIIAAWDRISVALGLGTTDPESGRFTPFASVVDAIRIPGGDLDVVFDLPDRGKTAASLKPAIGPLLRELRVKELVGGVFTTRQVDGMIIGRFSNGGTVETAAQQQQLQSNDGEGWNF
jgi:hypothetical protein